MNKGLLVINRTYAVALSTAVLPAAAWYFPFQLLFVFALAERKNEQQKEDNVPLCMTTAGHRVSPVIKTSQWDDYLIVP